MDQVTVSNRAGSSFNQSESDRETRPRVYIIQEAQASAECMSLIKEARTRLSPRPVSSESQAYQRHVSLAQHSGEGAALGGAPSDDHGGHPREVLRGVPARRVIENMHSNRGRTSPHGLPGTLRVNARTDVWRRSRREFVAGGSLRASTRTEIGA